ncbi:MAG: hypothetical protein ABSH56_07545 [Bryobacteraceae bacterium]
MSSDGCQSEIRALAESLRVHGADPSNDALNLREAWSPSTLQLGGEFTVKLVSAIVPPLITGLAGWLHGRNGRRVHLKVDDIEVDAPSIDEVERLLVRAQELAKNSDKPRIITQSEK